MAGENKKYSTAGHFETLVGRRPVSYDPSTMEKPAPSTLTTTADVGVLLEGGSFVSGRMQNNATPNETSGQVGTVTVANNTFTAGAELLLGDYRIRSKVDFAIAGTAALTATNIAAFISTLPGFTASAALGVITVRYKDPSGKVVFRALHYGSVTNFTPFSPSTGFLGGGSPYAGTSP